MKQLSTDVAGACACQKMRQASRKISRMYDDALRPTGIKNTQFTMLSVITRNDGTTLTKLAEILGVERTTLSRNLGPLERSGLIAVSAEGYRRSRSASITEKGVTVLEKALPLWRSAQKSLRKRLGDDIWNRIQNELTEVGQLL